jgi:hypothetical protein
MTMKIEDELRRTLRQAAQTAAPSPDAWDRIEQRRPTAARQLLVIAVAFAIGTLGVVVALRSFDGHGRAMPDRSPASSAPVGTVRMIELDWGPTESASGIAALGGYAWTAGNQSSALIGLDGTVTPLPFTQAPFSISSSSLATWAAGYEPEMRDHDYVARFPVGSASPDLLVPLHDIGLSQVVASDSATWVLGYPESSDSLGTLLQLDPTSGDVVQREALSVLLPPTLGANPIVYATSADDRALWILVADVKEGTLGRLTLARLDLTTGHVETFDPGSISAFVAGDDSAWLPGPDGPVRLDASTGRTEPISALSGRSALVPFAVAPAAVWFIGGNATEVQLVRLDIQEESAHVGLELTVDRKSGWGSVEAAYDGNGSVWLLYETGELQQITV